MEHASVGDLIPLRGPIARVKVKNCSRPHRLIAFAPKRSESAILTPLLMEMSSALDQISHPIVDGDRYWSSVFEPPSKFQVGLISWLLALHRFAPRLPETSLMSADDAQPRDWNETENLVSLIENTATASARFADWLLNEKTIQDVIEAGRCPVQLNGPGNPPILHGNALLKPLSGDQYDIMVELVKAFPKGLSEKDFLSLEGTKHIGSPRHTLMDLRGTRVKQNTVWTDVILGPQNTGLGWRLKPT